MELLFTVFDVNKDSMIDRQELLFLLEAIDAMKSRKTNAIQQVNEIFKFYDKDNSSSLSKEEFFDVLEKGEIFH
jgi:Ca2+-binding EF-hand superfamily protein